jgi:hypothetical protein
LTKPCSGHRMRTKDARRRGSYEITLLGRPHLLGRIPCLLCGLLYRACIRGRLLRVGRRAVRLRILPLCLLLRALLSVLSLLLVLPGRRIPLLLVDAPLPPRILRRLPLPVPGPRISPGPVILAPPLRWEPPMGWARACETPGSWRETAGGTRGRKRGEEVTMNMRHPILVLLIIFAAGCTHGPQTGTGPLPGMRRRRCSSSHVEGGETDVCRHVVHG